MMKYDLQNAFQQLGEQTSQLHATMIIHTIIGDCGYDAKRQKSSIPSFSFLSIKHCSSPSNLWVKCASFHPEYERCPYSHPLTFKSRRKNPHFPRRGQKKFNPKIPYTKLVGVCSLFLVGTRVHQKVIQQVVLLESMLLHLLILDF